MGKAGQQRAIVELKQHVIASVNKLGDRDTYQLAAKDLENLAQTVSPDGLGSFLSCVYETDSQHKSSVRRECVRLFGALANCHGELLAPHLPKIVQNIIRRLKDPDSNVRDACVDAIGVLARRVVRHRSGNNENGGPLFVLVKPLFDALGEQNRHLQVGSALCLSRAIDNANDPSTSNLQRLLPRLLKLLNNNNFFAKAALLSVIGSIVKAEAASLTQQTLGVLIPCIEKALESSEWATRKAAAECLGRMALSLGLLLASFKSSCLISLESRRFDKVKPVRDTVVQTLQVWKSIPSSRDDDDAYSSPTERISSVKENVCEGLFPIDLNSSSKASSLKKKIDTLTKSAHNHCLAKSTTKRTPLTDKKTNPAFFPKAERKKANDWQFEVAFPRSCPPPKSKDFENIYSTVISVSGKDKSNSNTGYRDSETFPKEPPRSSQELRSSFETKCNPGDQISEGKIEATPTKKPTGEVASPKENSQGNQCADSLATQTSCTSSSSSPDVCTVAHSANDLALIREQLVQIENRQSGLLQLLQVFMTSSEESMCALETRVNGLERIVDEMAQDLALSTGRLCNVEHARFRCRRFLGADFFSSKFWKKNEGRCSPSTLAVSDDVPSMAKLRQETSYNANPGTNVCEDNRYRHLPRRFNFNPLADFQETSCRGGTQMLNRASDKTGKQNRFDEGLSARSFWQASVDDATVADMQVAGKIARAEQSGTMKTNSRSNIPDKSMENSFSKAKEHRNDCLMNFWTHATEYLQNGDIDSAFVEVLCSGDDLQLIRLINWTGPVLEHLSQGTVAEMMQTVTRLLVEQKYLDLIIPWIQQVVDLTRSNGPEYLDLSLEAKQQTLLALQEAASMHFSDVSSRKTVVLLASELGNIWASDIL